MALYGMNPEIVAGEAGRATTIKTLANIYYKGIQALCLELAISAWKVGIDPQLLAPLVIKPVESLPKDEEMAFWIVRGIVHAERKAAELESIIKAVRQWGVKPIMLDATRKRLKSVSDPSTWATASGSGPSLGVGSQGRGSLRGVALSGAQRSRRETKWVSRALPGGTHYGLKRYLEGVCRKGSDKALLKAIGRVHKERGLEIK
jgi:hypothetical protein